MSKFKSGWDKYTRIHYRLVDFGARRVVAPGFIVVGLLVAAVGMPAVLPGGIVLVNGVPDDDLVMRWASVLLPLLVSGLGVALYRAKPLNS